MKSIKFLFLALVFIAQTAVANTTNPLKVEKPKVVVAQISTLLENPEFVIEAEMIIEVSLIVNSLKQIVVVDIANATDDAATFIKSRLNYTEVRGAVAGDQFTIPVRMVPAN